mgnify:CR=1 FL=1
MTENVRVSLSPKHRKAAELLAAGCSVRETAASLGVSDRTIRRWARRPEVVQALQELQEEAWGATIRKLRSLGERAVITLGEVMRDRQAPPMARVGAARAVLELVFKLGELEQLRERIERLETKLKGNERRE